MSNESERFPLLGKAAASAFPRWVVWPDHSIESCRNRGIRSFDAGRGVGGVIDLDDFDLSAEYSTGRVDLVSCELNAPCSMPRPSVL